MYFPHSQDIKEEGGEGGGHNVLLSLREKGKAILCCICKRYN